MDIKRILTLFIIIFTLSSAEYNHYQKHIKYSRYYYILNDDTLFTIHELQKEGLSLYDIDAPLIDFVYGKIKPGWIYLKKDETLLDAIKKIGSDMRAKTKKVYFYSSDTIDDFSKYFSKLNNTDTKTVKTIYKKLSPWKEGGIIASIYNIPYHADVKQVLRYMVSLSNLKFKKIAQKYGVKYPSKEFEKYLIIASIIQKESWLKEEMPKISAVIHNRLKKGMRLQMDATLNYGKYSHTVVTPKRIRSDKSRYNTYLYKGLPPHPLGSVTVDALEAAFNPYNEDYLFFVNNIFGFHDFSSNYSKHSANISRIKAERAKLSKTIYYLRHDYNNSINISQNSDKNSSTLNK